uniref:Uncharacterized protein n=1 Tax=Anguilla anguilla TaxID=7936 RepID=A0A0E9U235_ANGAN
MFSKPLENNFLCLLLLNKVCHIESIT